MTKTKDEKLEVGQPVYIIDDNLTIAELKILSIIDSGEGEKLYKIRKHSCEGLERKRFFISKPKAEKYLQDVRNRCKFMVGDIVIIDEKNKKKDIGRIEKIRYNFDKDNIRYFTNQLIRSYNWSRWTDEYDEIELTKVNNDYIENYEEAMSIREELEIMEKSFENKIKDLQKVYENFSLDIIKDYKLSRRPRLFGKKKDFSMIFIKQTNDEDDY